MPLLVCICIGALIGSSVTFGPVAAIAGGFFLFLASWEFNPRELFTDYKVTLRLWLGAFALPFLCGWGIVQLCPQLFTSDNPQATSLVLGIAMAVSAVPVIIKIMQELGWAGTERAKRVLATAILCDLSAWALFIPLLPKAGQAGWIASHLALFLFFLGLLIAFAWPKVTKPKPKLQFVNQWIIAPVFFITIGQKLDFTHGFDGLQAAIIFIVATVSKMVGVWIAARYSQLEKQECFALAISLNARGAMEVVMASFAANAGLINKTLFLSLVLMAISTSLIIKPIFKFRAKGLLA